MKKLLKIILKTGVAFAIIIFLTILSSLFSSTNADESIVCCNPGASLLDPCIYNLGPPPVGGTCRSWETPVEWGACGYTNQLTCDDHYHPGDYSCQCFGPDPQGLYDCNYISNDCHYGFRPSCSNCGPNLSTPGCAVGNICQLTCILGNPGGAGTPCLCNYDCQSGLYCGPTGICQLTGLPTPTITPGSPSPTPPSCVAEGGICEWPTGSSPCCTGLECNVPDPSGDPFLRCGQPCGREGSSCCTTGTECSGNLTCSNDNICIRDAVQYCDEVCTSSPYLYGVCWGGNPDSSRCQRPVPTQFRFRDCDIGGTLYDCYCCNEYIASVGSSTPVTVMPRPAQTPNCVTNGQPGINTAIGCIPFTDTNAFIGFILRWAIGIAGGVAFILIVVAAFQIITSTGNPQKIQAGKELLTAAIAGLMLIIFSVFILQLIGVSILRIPGL